MRKRVGLWEILAVTVVTALLVGTLWLTWPVSAQAEELTRSVTGIPIEVLFGLVGAMGTVIYLDMKREIRRVAKDAEKQREDGESRSRMLVRIHAVVAVLCRKLDIPYPVEHDRRHDDFVE